MGPQSSLPNKFMKGLVRYFTTAHGILPSHVQTMDAHRLTLLQFSIAGLAILNEIHHGEDEYIIDFVYAHQIPPSEEYGTSRSGFRGSSFIGVPLKVDSNHDAKYTPLPYDACHVTTNYSALVVLLLLGDDLSRVNRQAIIDGIRSVQHLHGNIINGGLFCPEFDARFIYSAVASAYILDMLYQLDLDAFEKFFADTMTYEGAFGIRPKMESHAGITYCVLASLKLMGRLDAFFPPGSIAHQKLVNWLLARQEGGFNGRCHKPPDSCYTFWVGASLRILNAHTHVEKSSLLKFLCSTYDPIVGGFMKSPDADYADPLHSYSTLAGLSCLFTDPEPNSKGPGPTELALTASMKQLDLDEASASELVTALNQLVEEYLQPLVPELNVPYSALQHLGKIHQKWRSSYANFDIGNRPVRRAWPMVEGTKIAALPGVVSITSTTTSERAITLSAMDHGG